MGELELDSGLRQNDGEIRLGSADKNETALRLHDVQSAKRHAVYRRYF